MARQWRTFCESCGTGFRKMHTQLSESDVRTHLSDDEVRASPDRISDRTFIRCNNCGDVKEVAE